MRFWQLNDPAAPWLIPSCGGVMGILNVTPDSFSDGGRYTTPTAALEQAHRMIQAGVHIIDIGGESTRPGAEEVPEEEELRRTIPTISALHQAFPELKISIDTRHPTVARRALDAGAIIINDITGLASAEMRALCAERPCGIVLMHMQGTPRTMQHNPCYDDVVAEVRLFFEQRLNLARQSGIAPERICLDPGIGFGKTTEHNLALIAHLEQLRTQDRPLLMALSRKRFMGAILGDPELPKNSPVPTVAMSLLAADRGADLHRVHDPAPLLHALQLRAALQMPD